VDTSTHHLSAFGHHVTIGTGFPIYEGGEEGLLPSVNILRFHRSTLASTIQTTFTKVSTDLIPAAPLWLRDTCSPSNKGEGPSKASERRADHATTISIGFSHPHPGIQTQWTPWPGPESRVVSRSLTTPPSTKKMRNHRFGHGKDITKHNRSDEEGAYQR
jgi:hypothetical protein